MRKDHGVASVRVILASDWMAAGDTLRCVPQAFHRSGSSLLPERAHVREPVPVCRTRYPCFPKGCKKLGRARVAGARASAEVAIKQRFESLLQCKVETEARLKSVQRWQLIVEINFSVHVVVEVLVTIFAILQSKGYLKLQCLYYCESRKRGPPMILDALCGRRAFTHKCNIDPFCIMVKCYCGFNAVNVCLMDEDAARIYGDGDGWLVDMWLRVLARYREFFEGTVWAKQSKYIVALQEARREDDFAAHLTELWKWRHVTFLEDERRHIGSGMPCKHCLPEWYGWLCTHCGRSVLERESAEDRHVGRARGVMVIRGHDMQAGRRMSRLR